MVEFQAWGPPFWNPKSAPRGAPSSAFVLPSWGSADAPASHTRPGMSISCELLLWLSLGFVASCRSPPPRRKLLGPWAQGWGNQRCHGNQISSVASGILRVEGGPQPLGLAAVGPTPEPGFSQDASSGCLWSPFICSPEPFLRAFEVVMETAPEANLSVWAEENPSRKQGHCQPPPTPPPPPALCWDP